MAEDENIQEINGTVTTTPSSAERKESDINRIIGISHGHFGDYLSGEIYLEESEKADMKNLRKTEQEERYILEECYKDELSNVEEAFKGLVQLETLTQEGEQQALPEQVTAQLNKQFEALDATLTQIAKEKYALLPREKQLRLRVLSTDKSWRVWRKIAPSAEGKVAKRFFPSVQAKLKAREAWIKACKQQLLEDYIQREEKKQSTQAWDRRIEILNKLGKTINAYAKNSKKDKGESSPTYPLEEKARGIRVYQELWIKHLGKENEKTKNAEVQFDEEEKKQYKALVLTKTQKRLIRGQVDPVLGEKQYRKEKERKRRAEREKKVEVLALLSKSKKGVTEDEKTALLFRILEGIRTPAEIKALLQEEKKTRTLEEQVFKKYYKEEKNNVEAAFKNLSLAQVEQYSEYIQPGEKETFMQSLVQPRLAQQFKVLDAELTQIAKEKYAALPEGEQVHLKLLRTRKLPLAFGWLKYVWPSPEWKVVQWRYPSLKEKLKKRERWIKDCKQHLLQDYIEKERGKWEAQKWETKIDTLKAEREKLEAIQNTWRSARPWRWTRYSYSWIVKKRIQKLDALLEKIEKLHEYNDKWIIYIAEKHEAESTELDKRTDEGEEEQLSEAVYKDLQMTETQEKLIRKEGDRRVGEVQDRLDSVRKQQKRRGIYTEVEDEITPEGGAVSQDTRKTVDSNEFVIMTPEQPEAFAKMLRKIATKRYEQRFGKVSLAHKIRALNPWAKQLKNVLRVRAMRKEQTIKRLIPVLRVQYEKDSEAKETQLNNLSNTLAEAGDLFRSTYEPAVGDGKANQNITPCTEADIETEIEQLKGNEKAHGIVVEQSKTVPTDGTRTLVSSGTASSFTIGTTTSKPGGTGGNRFKALPRIMPFGKSKRRKKGKTESQPASSIGVSMGS